MRHGGGRRTETLQGEREKRKIREEKEERDEKRERKGEESMRERCITGEKHPLELSKIIKDTKERKDGRKDLKGRKYSDRGQIEM